MYDAILVPTDGSDHALRAARHGLGLAERFDATVHVLGVVDVQSAAGPFDAGGISGEFVERLEATASEWTEAVAETAPAGLDLHATTANGQPRTAILEYADEHDVDLVAMGTHGRSGIRRYLAGSVTEHVLRRASVPVLTARDGDRPPRTEYESVLVPTDGSNCAAVAVDHGLAVAEAYDATVHAAYVVDITVVASQADPVADPPLSQQLRTQGEEATSAVADRARDRGLDAETTVLEGRPSRELLGYADEHGVDLVTMGTHGRSGFDRFILGSTTERTVREAEMPVLAVPGRPDEER